jgi:predicted dehydrogenase
MINWGIIGLGKIANIFASDLMLAKEAKLYAVASRDARKAAAFGEEFGCHTSYASYEALAKDPNIDIVYIATPHTYHFANTLMCLKYGKAVLCEKPLAISLEEEELLYQEAKNRKLFLMEAMWTRFLPATEKLIQLVNDGAIGQIQSLHADFGFRANLNPEHRLFNKQLGGGSLLDIGIYPIYLSLLLLGRPHVINAMARMSNTAVDSFCTMLFGYEHNAIASLESSIEGDTPTEAYVYGSKGHIVLHRRFHQSEKLSLYQQGGLCEVFELPFRGNGYIHEIEEVNGCLLHGKTESPKHTLSNSLKLIEIIDRVKEEIGLQY